MALNIAEPDAALVAAADAYLVGIKDHGVKFGVTTAELLNTELVENADLVLVDVRTQAETDEKGIIDARTSYKSRWKSLSPAKLIGPPWMPPSLSIAAADTALQWQ